MKALRAETATELFALACGHLAADGVKTERSGAPMIEATGPVTLTLDYPEQNLVLQPGRRINPWVSLAEFPWMIAGRGDVAWLAWYLPRALAFSDDALKWRAAYGPRLRKYEDANGLKTDQLAYIVNELRIPGGSRRAAATIWVPGVDYVAHSRDYPCTNWLSFQHRPGAMALDLTVAMRSNDLWWGWSGVNVVNWPPTLEEIGFPETWEPERALNVLTKRLRAGKKTYTGAYMLTGTLPGTKPEQTVLAILDPLWRDPIVPQPGSTLQESWAALIKRPGFAGFMAYEVVTDWRQTRYLEAAPDIMTWAHAGPGAVRGLNRLHGRHLKQRLAKGQALDEMRALLAEAAENLPVGFPRLELRDIEHSLCETDKYLRVAMGEGKPRARFDGKPSGGLFDGLW